MKLITNLASMLGCMLMVVIGLSTSISFSQVWPLILFGSLAVVLYLLTDDKPKHDDTHLNDDWTTNY